MNSSEELGAATNADPESGAAEANASAVEANAVDAPGTQGARAAAVHGDDLASAEGVLSEALPEAGVTTEALVAGAGLAANVGDSPAVSAVSVTDVGRPTYVFLGAVAAVSLFLDIASKAWAEVTLNRRGFEPIELIDGHLAVTLAYNQGGAWGLFANVGEHLRKPFFLVVSATAIWFIVSLYGRLSRSQRALTWGLPLVLGGALGNLSDRITRSQVVDFIDYRAEWVLHTNSFISRHLGAWTVTDHWPTFNIADVAICIGVGLMAVDMFGSRKTGRGRKRPDSKAPPASVPPTQPSPQAVVDGPAVPNAAIAAD